MVGDREWRKTMQTWPLEIAEARFSDLLNQAVEDGPQDISVGGRSIAVMVSRELFDRLCGTGESLVSFMRSSPLAGQEDIVLERDGSLPREVAS
jgi:prevent-host-death family protein